MTRRTVWLHLGHPLPTDGGDGTLHTALAEHTEVLGAAGCQVVPATRGELTRAGLEIRRQHRQAGLKRGDVEGAWAYLCRRAHRDRGHTVLSIPRFAGARQEQAALAVDALAGFDVHAVLSARPGEEVTRPVEVWRQVLRPHHLHVVDLPADATPADLAGQLADVARDVLGQQAPDVTSATSRRSRLSLRRPATAGKIFITG